MILKGMKSQIDVKVTAEVDSDLGRTIPVTFVATFRKPPVSETREVLEQVQSAEGVDDESLMDRFLLGWKELRGEDGSDIPYTPEALAAVMDSREYRTALVRGLMSVLIGRRALEKN